MKKIFWMVPCLALALAACTNENEDVKDVQSRAELKVEIGVNQPVSRALIADAYFKDGEQVGISVEETDGTAYDDQVTGYINVPYEANGDVTVTDGKPSGQLWTATDPIILSATSGNLYAYFPYQSTGVTDHAAISVNNDNQTDWMYATPIQVSNSQAVAKIVMNHAQSAFKVIIKNSDSKPYNAEGKVSAITLQSPYLGTSGTLNAETGITALTDADAVDAVAVTETAITTSGIDFTHMMFPTFVADGDVASTLATTPNKLIVTVTMDGKTFKNTVSMNALFEKGKMYSITLTATGNDFVLGEDTNGDGDIDADDEPAVTIQPWGAAESIYDEEMEVVRG